MRTVFGAVHTEPVCTRQPDFIAGTEATTAVQAIMPASKTAFQRFHIFIKSSSLFRQNEQKICLSIQFHYTGYQKKSQALLGKIYEIRKMTGLHFCLHCVIIEVFDFYRLPEARRAFL